MEPTDLMSEHCTYAEFCLNSETAKAHNIDNTPTDEIIAAGKLLCEKVFEPIRAHFGVPLTISSFYRCPALNKAVGGVADSQHQYGMAMDIEMGWEINLQIMDWIKNNLQFDQVLNEYPDAQGRPTWVHVSYKATGNRNMFCQIN